MKDKLSNKNVRIGATAAAAILVLIIVVVTIRHYANTENTTADSSAAESSIASDVSSAVESSDDESSSAETSVDSMAESTDGALDDPDFQVPTWSAEDGEAHVSEGLNVPGGTEVSVKSDTPSGEIGKAAGFPISNPNYTMTIDSIGYGNTTDDGHKVLEVRYTYHNISVENLMIGQYAFKLLDKNQKALSIHYFNQDEDPIYGMQPATAGNSWTCVIGFISNSDCDEVTLLYEDPINSSYEHMIWTVKP